MRLSSAALTLAAALLSIAMPALASDKFLCVDGVRGDSRDDQFRDCSDATDYQQVITDAPAARGTAVKKCSIVVGKLIDSASPAFWTRAANGTPFSAMTVTFRKAGEVGFVFFTAALTNIVVDKVELSDQDAAGSSIDVEKNTLVPGHMDLKFTPQTP